MHAFPPEVLQAPDVGRRWRGRLRRAYLSRGKIEADHRTQHHGRKRDHRDEDDGQIELAACRARVIVANEARIRCLFEVISDRHAQPHPALRHPVSFTAKAERRVAETASVGKNTQCGKSETVSEKVNQPPGKYPADLIEASGSRFFERRRLPAAGFQCRPLAIPGRHPAGDARRTDLFALPPSFRKPMVRAARIRLDRWGTPGRSERSVSGRLRFKPMRHMMRGSGRMP